MNKPEPMTPEQIANAYKSASAKINYCAPSHVDIAKEIEAARDAQWEEMLSKQEPFAYANPSSLDLFRAGKIAGFHIGCETTTSTQPIYAAPVMAEKQEPVTGKPEGGWQNATTPHNFGNPMGYAVVTNADRKIPLMLDGGSYTFKHQAEAVCKLPEYVGTHHVIALVAAPVMAEKQEPIGEAYLCDQCSTPFDGYYECPKCGNNTSTKEPVYAAPVDQAAEIERLEKELSAVNEHLWATEDDVISLRHQLDDQQAEIERLRSALARIAENKGNGDHDGCIARAALEQK